MAISIPIFTTQLEKAREAVDAANIRAAYAEVMNAALTEDATNYTKTVTMTQDTDGWQTTINWPSNLSGANGSVKANGTATVTYTAPTGSSSEGTVAVTYS